MSRLAPLWLALFLLAGIARAAPLWQDGLDFDGDALPPALVAVGGERAFYVKNAQLIATDLRTGRRLWKYGGELAGALALEGERVYVSSRGGSVYALEAKTGRRLWTAGMRGYSVQSLMPAGEILLVDNGLALALDAASGITLWQKRFDDSSNGPVGVASGVVVWSYSFSGTLTYTQAVGLDLKTGAQRWEVGSNDAFLLLTEGQRFFFDVRWGFNHFDGRHLFPVREVDARTGRGSTVEYNLEPGRKVASDGLGVGSRQVMDRDCLWLQVTRGESYRVECYPRNQSASPISYNVQRPLKWVAGPHLGRLLFVTPASEQIELPDLPAPLDVQVETGPLVALDIKTRQRMEFRFDGYLARLDLLGNGVFVGLEDGRFLAFDLRTGRLALEARTKARVFGPTLVSSDTILVQAERELLAYPLPPSLR